jgi:hypothetical protein
LRACLLHCAGASVAELRSGTGFPIRRVKERLPRGILWSPAGKCLGPMHSKRNGCRIIVVILISDGHKCRNSVAVHASAPAADLEPERRPFLSAVRIRTRRSRYATRLLSSQCRWALAFVEAIGYRSRRRDLPSSDGRGSAGGFGPSRPKGIDGRARLDLARAERTHFRAVPSSAVDRNVFTPGRKTRYAG